MSNPKISVIIPVYNVEKYIKRCLDSLLNQTFKDFEVVVVNDATPDQSMVFV
jgi:glycosyltransferase involved in cell wall biosynthesis